MICRTCWIASSRRPKTSPKVSIGEVMDRLRQHSFAPMLLLPGLIMAAPVVGDISGVPAMMGLIVILGSVQVVNEFRFPEITFHKALTPFHLFCRR